jgi:predicted cupin superfamily sugar epimerase
MKLTWEDIVRILKMIRLPQEGGFYTETYRSKDTIPAPSLPGRYHGGSRAMTTVIYYLITESDCSKMHRVASDEVFCYHLGDPVTMLLLYPNGQTAVFTLGNDLIAGQMPHIVVPAGTWQGMRVGVKGQEGYSLLSCIVAPGFEFADFEIGDWRELTDNYPDASVLIRELT